jgi:uncharacterized protein
MGLVQAREIVDLTYGFASKDEPISFAFFGGEPLLEFAKIQAITIIIKKHQDYDAGRVSLTVITNGTIFNNNIARFISENEIAFGISCDGAPAVHDRFRRYRNGKGSSARVERTICDALDSFSKVMVNAVYGPETIAELPETVHYFSQLGVRQIYLSPDYSAPWTAREADQLDRIYGEVGERFMSYYRQGDPHFVSLVDSKIAVILRGGYQPEERCRMGTGELAFTPDGKIYPCERLVGNSESDTAHCLGSVDQGIDIKMMDNHRTAENTEHFCSNCSLKDYCMNWCGCSNYFGSGHYNRVSPFLCASEQAAIRMATHVYSTLERDEAGIFYEHASGSPLMNSIHYQI